MRRYLIWFIVTVVLLSGACFLLAGSALADQMVLDGVPEYYWWHGCTPTAGGMMIGYWDGQPGYQDLFTYGNGDASDDAGSQQTHVRHMIASGEHIAATHDPVSCTHTDAPNSVACFMHTSPYVSGSGGATYPVNVAVGLRRYAAWDDPDTAASESYYFDAVHHDAYNPDWPDDYNACTATFDDIKYEIEEGRPLLVNSSVVGGGHTGAVYGYQDNPGDNDDWLAMYDTWEDGDSGAYSVVDKVEGGVEWWRWDLWESGEDWGHAYFFDSAVYFSPDLDGPIDEVEGNNSFAAAQAIDLVNQHRQTIIASIGTGTDEDYYKISLNEGDRLLATTSADNGGTATVDTRLYFRKPDGSYAKYYSDDHWGGSYLSNLMWIADQTGEWRVLVDSYEDSTGDYYLTLDRVPEPTTIALLCAAVVIVGLKLRRRKSEQDAP